MKRQLKAPSVVAGVVGAIALSGLAAPAHAAVIDTDQVYAAVAGEAISGSVSWRNYYSGFGSVTVYNQTNDGLCTSAQQRVMRAGVWSAWSDIVVLCTAASYTANVYVTSNNQVVQNWQFRVRDANSGWAYDTNSPGGA